MPTSQDTLVESFLFLNRDSLDCLQLVSKLFKTLIAVHMSGKCLRQLDSVYIELDQPSSEAQIWAVNGAFATIAAILRRERV